MKGRSRASRDEALTLRRRQGVSVGQSLAIRGLLVLALLSIALFGHWVEADGLRDNLDDEISFVDLIYFTAVTITTVGYGDIVPVSQGARLFDALVVTPIRLFVWLIFLGTTYTFVLRRAWDHWQSKMIKQKLSGHIIICGFGGSGSATAVELLRKGFAPDRIVVVDPDEDRVAAAVQLGLVALKGDATRNAILSAASIETAGSLIVSPGRDDSTTLVVLTARQLNPAVRISASVREQENENLVRQAGADTVVNPASFGGHLLAESLAGRHTVDYIQDLMTAGGRIVIHERPITPDEVGKALRDLKPNLGLRIHRGQKAFGFWEKEADRLEAGDIVVEVVPLNGGPPAGDRRQSG